MSNNDSYELIIASGSQSYCAMYAAKISKSVYLIFANVYYNYETINTVYTLDKYIDFDTYDNVEVLSASMGIITNSHNATGASLDNTVSICIYPKLNGKRLQLYAKSSKAGTYNVNVVQLIGLVHAY